MSHDKRARGPLLSRRAPWPACLYASRHSSGGCCFSLLPGGVAAAGHGPLAHRIAAMSSSISASSATTPSPPSPQRIVSFHDS